MRAKYLEPGELRRAVAVVVGTRPGIIKMSPLIRALQRRGVDHFLVHTGQHYSYRMDRRFFEELDLPKPAHWRGALRSQTLHGAQTAAMLRFLEAVFVRERPGVVVVGGDANTNLAGALAARKLRIPVAHVEAGLRSGDWRMPEEHNRVMIDHIAELLFAPTAVARANLVRDHVRGRIVVTGNTIVDAVRQNLARARARSAILADLGLRPRGYFVVTAHREETVDSRDGLHRLLEILGRVAARHDTDLVFPLHPRTARRLREYGLEGALRALRRVRRIRPLGYLDFLQLLGNARLILTDSGGIQEEACVMGVPCVTLRASTERPETVAAGANLVAGLDVRRALRAVRTMLGRARGRWKNPLGDGRAAERMAAHLQRQLRHVGR